MGLHQYNIIKCVCTCVCVMLGGGGGGGGGKEALQPPPPLMLPLELVKSVSNISYKCWDEVYTQITIFFSNSCSSTIITHWLVFKALSSNSSHRQANISHKFPTKRDSVILLT